MKILWITNTLFPEPSIKLNINLPVIQGWVYAAAKGLLNYSKDIKLAIVTPYDEEKTQHFEINNINYYLIPSGNSKKKYDKKLENYFAEINLQFSPDIVHLHGTEYPYYYAFIKACGNTNVVVSMQGILNMCERYYFAGIKKSILFKSISIRDIIRLDTTFNQKKSMKLRSVYEYELLKSVKFIIGRTNWDKMHTSIINPEAKYFKCNETLRDEFYSNEIWSFENCDKYSIFISQGYYPIKGLHQVINALPLVLKHFPEAKIFVAGNNFFSRPWWRLHDYARYILNLIKKNGVNNKVIFLGSLSAFEMKKKYLESNVFVCPSAIENSPNSIGEAQILGVPCVAADVGGMKDLIEDNKSGLLYRFEEFEILAYHLIKIFSDKEYAFNLSEESRKAALKRHNQRTNAETLLSIYKTILKNINPY